MAKRVPSVSPKQFVDQTSDQCPHQAVKMVRGEMGLKNVEIMIPFVRTLDMAKDVNEVLASRLVNRRFRGLKGC